MATIIGENLAPAQGLGLATVLRPDYTPLRIMQQGDAVRARRAAAEAALKQKQAADLAKQWAEDRKLGLDTGGLFQEAFNSYTADAQDIIGKNYADEQAGRITTAERIQNIANYKNEIEREKLLGVDKDKAAASYIDSQRVKPFRDIQGLDTALGESVVGPDGKRVRASAFDERAMINKWDADPRTYTVQPILDDYYKGLQASTIDEANAGRIGGINSSSSITYKGLIPVRLSDGTWDVKRDAAKRPVLSITKDELATARASNHNLNMAVSRLRYEYDNQRKANPALPDKSDLDLFQESSQKYVSFRQADSEGRNAQPRAAARAGKLKAGQATFTPTSSYGLSVSENETTPTIDNRGGKMGAFLGNAAVQPGQKVPQKYNFPRVGVDFASERAPSVKVKVNTRDLFVLGKGGESTRYNKNDVNSLVDGNATGRHFVLEVNGKRMGLPTEGVDGRTSADAFEDLKGIISRMSPEEARRAVLKSYYEVGVAGKSSVSGDGTGGRAKIVGYKDADGDFLDSAGVAEARRTGSVFTPVYDKEEVQDITLAPATAGLDAQVSRATPGYNPRQRTEQEKTIIRLLEAKGGRVSDPYHTTPTNQAPAAKPARPSFLPAKAGATKTATRPTSSTAGKSGGML